MAEYIEREAVLEILRGRSAPWDGYQKVKELPAADVRPVVHGHDTGNARIFECSECGYGFADIFLTNERDYPIDPNFCPNCGADMREES